MTACQECQTEWFTSNMPGGRDFRCAVCGNISSLHLSSAKSGGQQGAWWSLVFGATSLLAVAIPTGLFIIQPQWWLLGFVILAVIAGLLAVYLGIRALLRIRYQATTKPVLLAAIGGTFTGGMFGILMGGVFLIFSLVVAAITYSIETTDGPEASMVAVEKMFAFEMPAETEMQPWRVRYSPFVFGSVYYRDAKDFADSSVWMTVIQYPKWAVTQPGQVTANLKVDFYNWLPGTKFSADANDELKWTIAGNRADITRITWRITNDQQTAELKHVFQYLTIVNRGEKTFGIGLAHRPDKSGLDEDDIRSIFESFQPVAD